jgi:hypothetical protein
MLEPLGERVAALTAEQRKYFISRVLANWEALMEPRGTISTRAMRKSAPEICVLQPPFFVMRPILVCLHPKAGMAFLNPRKSPFGAGGGGKVFLHRGPPRALYTGYGSNAYLTT